MKLTFATLIVGLAATAAAAQQTETVTLDAYSVWSATGAVLGVGPHSHAFAGEMRGPYFIDVGQGAIPAGEIACVGSLLADEETGKQSGEAMCRLMAFDGAVAFAQFACDGYRLVGCVGEFQITGGEGRMAGASGAGSIVLRRYDTTLALDESGAVAERALGVASWKGFSITVAAPAQ